MPLMTVSNLKKRYFLKEALCGVSMALEPGRIYGLLGPNGSGKTTLLKTIAGVLQPDGGEIAYPGGAARGTGSKGTVSFLPDMMSFPRSMRVRDAFAFWQDMYPDFSAQKADTMMGILDLAPEAPIKRLSMGVQERVALALVFSRNASVYLLDEPLGGIDPIGKAKVLDSIITAQLSDSCILLSTHLVKDIEAILDGFFIIAGGKIVFEGDCEKIREQSGKTCEQVYLEVFSNAAFN